MSEKKYATFRDLKAAATGPEKSPATSISSIPSTTSISSTPSRPRTLGTSKPVAPERDFQRVPNSVTRQAIPQGLFRGSSKKVWDYLYSVTRGAVVPMRTVRKSRKEIKAGSGLGSMVTVDAAIEHLTGVGLLSVKPAVGSLVGNEYEVFTPEEAAARSPSTTSISSTSSIPSLTQNLDYLDVPESSSTSTTQVVATQETSSQPNTSFKTKDRSDDEAFADLIAKLRQASREATGREATAAERARWSELADLLVAEFKIAAVRTDSISSVPAFLTEHLRRRLWKKDKAQLERESREAPAESMPLVDASKCPACGGSGWHYPEGPERGVARCRHDKLRAEPQPGT